MREDEQNCLRSDPFMFLLILVPSLCSLLMMETAFADLTGKRLHAGGQVTPEERTGAPGFAAPVVCGSVFSDNQCRKRLLSTLFYLA